MNETEETSTPNKVENNSETNNIILLMWIGTFFFGFIPSLIIYLVKKDNELITDQAKEALNWSITALLGYVIGSLLMFVLIGFLVLPAVGICHLVFCILGAVNASKGIAYRLPFNIRLIK